LNFDYTYLPLFGFNIFEPTTILTNAFITIFCIYSFFKIKKFKNKLSSEWSTFFLLIGLSSSVGSIAHGTHYQLGEAFVNTIIFLMNAISLIAIYFCFKATYTYLLVNKAQPKKYINYSVIVWIVILLILTFINNNFLLIKIHAGIVLTFSIIVHYIGYFKKHIGSGWVAFGILISFASIAVHSLKLSVNDWFNYKDISHLIMLTATVFMVKGVLLKLQGIIKLNKSTQIDQGER